MNINHIIENLLLYIENFNAIDEMITGRLIIVFLVLNIMSFLFIRSYLGVVFSLHKSERAIKIISKQYNFVQRLFCVHYNENVYKKVDRSFFNLVYKFHYFYVCMFLIIPICIWISKYIDIFNEITCILFYFDSTASLLVYIMAFIIRRDSPTGGVEYSIERKYKNW